jgi:hypothetical protein
MSEDMGEQSKTRIRGLSISKACSGSRAGLTLVEILETSDLASSTVHRWMRDGQSVCSLTRLCCTNETFDDRVVESDW